MRSRLLDFEGLKLAYLNQDCGRAERAYNLMANGSAVIERSNRCLERALIEIDCAPVRFGVVGNI